MLLQYDRHRNLPTAKDLPDSDETPVDNELQNEIPNLLRSMLSFIWPERMDWFFGVDMGIYYHPEQPAVIPDAFLSIGVPRIIDEGLRLSYVLWEEQKLPILFLEVVSQTRRGEYTLKKDFYEEMGILYYVIYNPLRKRKAKLEVYRLNRGKYELLPGDTSVWLADIGIGITRERGIYQGIEREWLYWTDEQGQRHLTPEERVQDAQRQAQDAQRRAEILEEKLRKLGIDLNE